MFSTLKATEPTTDTVVDTTDPVTRIKKKYRVLENQKNVKSKLTPRKQLDYLLEHANDENKLLEKLATELTHYAKENLNRIGLGDNFTTESTNVGESTAVTTDKKSTHNDRAVAINLALELIKTASAEEVYEYLTTPYFQKLCGATTTKFNILRQHLSNIVSSFTTKYREFRAHASDSVIAELLLNEQITAEISPQELSVLFWHYSPMLVADILINVYQESEITLSYSFGTQIFTTADLRLLLDNQSKCLDNINRIRAKLKASQILPSNVRAPGKNQLEDEGLSALQLFQYDENAIFAVEHYFRDKYSHLLANKIENNAEDNKTKGKKIAANKAPYQFYLVSAAPYMLLEPSNQAAQNYDRYALFKKHIQELVASYDPTKHVSPLIFTGIINIDGAHYLPYFIYKNKKGEIQILTVDPSARTYPDSTEENKEPRDAKLKAKIKLSRIFKDIFPAAKFADADVSQMLRERDCGPNSATTLRDAFDSCESNKPLLKIENDQLLINTSVLTVKNEPVAVDHYTGSYVFPEKLEQDTLKNRAWWKDTLTPYTSVAPLTIRRSGENESYDRPMSIHDVYDLKEQFYKEFNYNELIENQEHQDTRNENISAVQSMLLSNNKGKGIINDMIAEYKKSLVMPSVAPLVKFISQQSGSTQTLETLTSAHNHDLTFLAEDVAAIILRDQIPSALTNLLQNHHLSKIVVRSDLDAALIVDEFINLELKTFSKLSVYQQRQLKNSFLQITQRFVQEKLLEHHTTIFNNLLTHHLRDYLAKMDPSIPQQDIASHIIRIALETKDIVYSPNDITLTFEYLTTAHPNRFNQIISTHFQKLTAQISADTNRKILASLRLDQISLQQLMSFITPYGDFIPWTNDILAKNIENIQHSAENKALNLHEVGSFLGIITLEQLNLTIYEAINSSLKNTIKISIEKLLKNEKLSLSLSRLSIAELFNHLQCHKDNTGIFSDDSLTNIVREFGQQETLHAKDFETPIIHSFAVQFLRDNIHEIIQNRFTDFFMTMSSDILSSNKDNLIFENATILSKLSVNGFADTTILTHLRTKSVSADRFVESFMPGSTAINQLTITEKLPLNPCGEMFYNWFCQNVINALSIRFQETDKLVSNILLSRDILEKIYSLLKNHIKLPVTSTTLIEEAKQTLSTLQVNVLSSSLTEILTSNSEPKLQTEFNRTIKLLCDHFFKKYYSIGDVTPTSLTSQLRPLLCSLLGININASILTDSMALMIDQRIKATLTNNNHQVFSIYEQVNNLLLLPKQTSLPDTYGKPLTKLLLLQCIAYWYNQRSLLFHMTHPSIWMEQDKLPEFMQALVRLANELTQYEFTDTVPAEYLPSLTRALTSHSKSELTIYGSNDLADKICASLLRTSTLTKVEPCTLQFSHLKSYLSLHEADKKKLTTSSIPLVNDQKQEERAPVTQQQILQRVREIRQKDANAKIDLAHIRKELEQQQPKIVAQASKTTLAHVKQSDLKRGMFESLTIFGGGLSHIEKILLQIQDKHHNQVDFMLDTDDVRLLELHLKKHWDKHCGEKTISVMQSQYARNPSRKDKAYIAISEFLANVYRNSGKEISYLELLMPEATDLKSYRYPESIQRVFDLPNDKSEKTNLHIDSIPLSDLVITRSGYAFDIHWVLNAYNKDRKLINPYTQKPFGNDELRDICLHPAAQQLHQQVISNNNTALAPDLVQMLREYLNGAIFTSGFDHYYNDTENEQAFIALTAFQKKLSLLPKNKAKALLNETIPGEGSDTVEKMFGMSVQIRSKTDDDNVRRDMCLTLRGVYLAKVVLAYEPVNHGLINATLVSRAGRPARRYYKNDLSFEFDDKITSHQENFIIDLFKSTDFKNSLRK